MAALQAGNRLYPALLIVVLCVAAVLRFVVLDQVPAGLYYDEAANAVDALQTLESGNWPAFYDSQGGKESLWMWLLAAVFWLAGVGILQIRLLAASLGLLTVVAVWWSAYELFSFAKESSSPKRDSFSLALLSVAVLATLFVHVHFSRDGYRLLTQPLLGSLAMAALWRGLRDQGRHWFVVGGVFLGLTMYTYSAARFYAVLLVIFFLLEWWLSTPRSTALLTRHFWFLVTAAAASTLVFAPMGLYFLSHPDLIIHRSSEVSFLNPVWNQGHPWAALVDSFWRNLAGIVWYGTENTHWNIPGRPLLDGLTIPLFLVGLVTAVRRWRRPSHLFLLLWLITLYLPAILSYDRVPVFHRAMGAVPAIAMLVAVGAWHIWGWLLHRLSRSPSIKNLAFPALAIVLISGSITAYDYFYRWHRSEAAYRATQPYFLDLVEVMNQNAAASAIYIFPYDLRNGIYEHPDLQLFYTGEAPYVSIRDHEGELFGALTTHLADKELVYVVDWKMGRSKEADPKGLIPALLTMYGQPLGILADTRGFTLEGFRLSGQSIDFSAVPPLQAANIPVGDGLALSGFAFGRTGQPTLAVGNPLTAGKNAWVLLFWKMTESAATDYKVSVRLIDPTNDNAVVAQNDKFLFNGFHLGTSHWRPDEEWADLYLLKPQTPGRYQLQVTVYNPTSLETLNPSGLTLPGWVEVE